MILPTENKAREYPCTIRYEVHPRVHHTVQDNDRWYTDYGDSVEKFIHVTEGGGRAIVAMTLPKCSGGAQRQREWWTGMLSRVGLRALPPSPSFCPFGLSPAY